MRHLYYGNPKLLDLSKFREVAAHHAAGDYRTKPEPCTIHYHRLGESCEGKEHEEFTPKEERADA